MKTQLFLLFICAASLFEMQAQEWGFDNAFEWEIMNNIWTQGPDTVWVVGNDLIAMSTDRGNTWNKQDIDYHSMMRGMIPPARLTDIIFCDQKNGFVIDQEGFVLKTTDGGNIWEVKDLENYGLNAIACTSLDNIWIAGDNGTVFRSTDSGETWLPVAIDTDQNKYNFRDIIFKDNTGYIAGGAPAVLYKTEDGGQTWSKHLTDDRNESIFHSLCLTENGAYMSLGNSSHRSILSLYHTQDYETWSETETPLDFTFESISFLDNMIGYAFSLENTSRNNIIFKTENGGNDWIPIEVNYGPPSYFKKERIRDLHPYSRHIQLVNDTTGYAVGGSLFFKTPLPDYDLWVGIKDLNISASFVLLYNRESNLLIQSEKLPIVSVQIMDISGKMLTSQRWDEIEGNEKEENTSVIPKGLYLVKTTLSDNSTHINKWIKN